MWKICYLDKTLKFKGFIQSKLENVDILDYPRPHYTSSDHQESTFKKTKQKNISMFLYYPDRFYHVGIAGIFYHASCMF